MTFPIATFSRAEGYEVLHPDAQVSFLALS
jgi:hypothetical protein